MLSFEIGQRECGFYSERTDRQTDRQTDRWTHPVPYSNIDFHTFIFVYVKYINIQYMYIIRCQTFWYNNDIGHINASYTRYTVVIAIGVPILCIYIYGILLYCQGCSKKITIK